MSTQFPIPGLPEATPEDAVSDEGAAQKRRRPTRAELLEGLNEPQQRAVTHEGTPLLVVAGAGSGKTRVLTRRIAWLISERNAHPGSILAITFTNKAAAEMRERVQDLVGNRARIMWVSTFHSACVRILRKEITKVGYKSSFTIYDAADSKRLMTLVCRDLDLDVKRFPPGAVLHWMSNAKNELQDPDDAAKDARNEQEETYAAAYRAYQERLRQANALDFDDLLMMTVHLFRAFPEVKENWRRRFRHVLVDEYQDTNHAQYALIHELCAPDPEADRDSDRATGRADGGRRRRPVDLRVPWREHPQHHGLREGLPRRRDRAARAELPLHPDHPHRGQLGDRQQRGSQAEEAVERCRRRREDRRVRRRRRARRGAVRRRGDRQAGRRGCGPRRRRGGVLPHQRPVTGVRGGVHPGRDAVQGRRRGALLRAPRGARRARLPAHAGQPRRPGLAAPDPEHPQAWHRRPGRGVRGVLCRPGADHLLGGSPARRRGARSGHPVAERDQGFRRPHRAAPVDGRGGGARRRGARAGAHPQRLPQGARGLRRPPGRDPGGEPRRAGRGRPRVRRRPTGRPERRPGRP